MPINNYSCSRKFAWAHGCMYARVISGEIDANYSAYEDEACMG